MTVCPSTETFINAAMCYPDMVTDHDNPSGDDDDEIDQNRVEVLDEQNYLVLTEGYLRSSIAFESMARAVPTYSGPLERGLTLADAGKALTLTVAMQLQAIQGKDYDFANLGFETWLLGPSSQGGQLSKWFRQPALCDNPDWGEHRVIIHRSKRFPRHDCEHQRDVSQDFMTYAENVTGLNCWSGKAEGFPRLAAETVLHDLLTAYRTGSHEDRVRVLERSGHPYCFSPGLLGPSSK